jgi:hypothetical protein
MKSNQKIFHFLICEREREKRPIVFGPPLREARNERPTKRKKKSAKNRPIWSKDEIKITKQSRKKMEDNEVLFHLERAYMITNDLSEPTKERLKESLRKREITTIPESEWFQTNTIRRVDVLLSAFKPSMMETLPKTMNMLLKASKRKLIVVKLDMMKKEAKKMCDSLKANGSGTFEPYVYEDLAQWLKNNDGVSGYFVSRTEPKHFECVKKHLDVCADAFDEMERHMNAHSIPDAEFLKHMTLYYKAFQNMLDAYPGEPFVGEVITRARESTEAHCDMLDMLIVLWESGLSPCAHCHTYQIELLKCSKCHTKGYCSKACQTSDWPKHKLVCKELTN